VFALQINRRASVTPHITFLVHTVVIQLPVLGIDRVTQQTWLDCFYGFVSLAVQRLPKLLIPTFPVPRFPVPRFLLPCYRYISVPSALNISFI